MFNKTKKKLEALETRVAALETTETWEFGRIPTSKLWQYITRLVRGERAKERERFSAMKSAIENGKLTINDARKSVGLQPLDDPQADQLLTVMQDNPKG